MDIRDLKLFLHLAESCHFGQTAKAMYVSPSTLSRQIQRLEEQIGQPLFVRDNRSVKLTEAGIALQHFAKKVLADYRLFKQSLNSNDEYLSGELSLFCSVTAAYSHLPTILDKFRILYPLVEIKLVTGDAADAVAKVQSNQADLAIAGRPQSLPTNIEFLKIGEIAQVLLIPKLNTLFSDKLHQKQPNWQDIPFILPEHGPSRRGVELWFKQNQITHPKIYATVAGHEAIVSMVALGCGVAILPKVVMENSPEQIRDRVIEWSANLVKPFDLGICVQKKRLSEKVIAKFWQLVQ